METLTVRFEPTMSPQSELLQALSRVIDVLKKQGVVSRAQVETVFPDDDIKYRGTFTVSFVGQPGPVQEAVNQLSGVRNAHIAPQRSAVRG